MLNKEMLIENCMEIVGWPYSSPGSNNASGIDCSGMFVRAYSKQGARIYHGSNMIIRKHCCDAKKTNGTTINLERGMAVFKHRHDGEESNQYKKGGEYYNETLIGNYFHIGLVASVEPLRIVHATTPVAKVDTNLSDWTWCARLKDVSYGKLEPDSATTTGVYALYAHTGATVNMRSKPTTATDNRVATIPIGELVGVIKVENGWAFANWRSKRGYIQTEYLAKIQSIVDENDADGEHMHDADVTITLPYEFALALYEELVRSLELS